MDETLNSGEVLGCGLMAGAGLDEIGHLKGTYQVRCVDPDGNELWSDTLENVVTTVGQNALLAAALQGATYTVTGPFMLLISAASFSAVAAADTMASHSGWLEAGSANAPTYTGTRQTVSFGTPSGGTIVSSGTINFVFTGSGTVEGIGMVFGSGATSAIANTSGTLLSAGTLTTPQPVISGNTMTATYTLAL